MMKILMSVRPHAVGGRECTTLRCAEKRSNSPIPESPRRAGSRAAQADAPGLRGPQWVSSFVRRMKGRDARSPSQRITLLVSPGVFRENARFA
jgi:hypothetical protein